MNVTHPASVAALGALASLGPAQAHQRPQPDPPRSITRRRWLAPA